MEGRGKFVLGLGSYPHHDLAIQSHTFRTKEKQSEQMGSTL
jgi:hypothetical protein